VIAQVVQILADGLRRNFKTPGEILHHHPAKGAGDIQDLGLAVGETGHDGTSGEDAPIMVRRFRRPVNMPQESAAVGHTHCSKWTPARADTASVDLQVWIRPVIGISLRTFQQKN
jgi:hypothetical protein